MLDQNRLKNAFAFHPATSAHRQEAHAGVRSQCLSLALTLDVIVPDSDEKLVMIDKLREVMYWANAAIACQTVIA